ncbi:MAG: hypothetical protein IJ087_22700 [Eggerthellaceae bacterium]|nr:hypothetical protein [Eggerthellaceae bacterium]
MSNIGDGFKNIFLAGIGALAYTGEKGKEVIDMLVAKGEITLEQGKELSDELQRKAGDTANDLRQGALEALMHGMTPEEREEFVDAATKIAQTKNAEEAAAAAEAEPEAEDAIEADVVDELESTAEEADAPAEPEPAKTETAEKE